MKILVRSCINELLENKETFSEGRKEGMVADEAERS